MYAAHILAELDEDRRFWRVRAEIHNATLMGLRFQGKEIPATLDVTEEQGPQLLEQYRIPKPLPPIRVQPWSEVRQALLSGARRR